MKHGPNILGKIRCIQSPNPFGPLMFNAYVVSLWQGTLLVNSIEEWCPLTCRDAPGSSDAIYDEGLFPDIVNRLSRKLNFSVEQIKPEDGLWGAGMQIRITGTIL